MPEPQGIFPQTPETSKLFRGCENVESEKTFIGSKKFLMKFATYLIMPKVISLTLLLNSVFTKILVQLRRIYELGLSTPSPSVKVLLKNITVNHNFFISIF